MRQQPSAPLQANAGPGAGAAQDALLAWFFVLVWGSGYLASKTGLQYAPPFTFLCLRFATGLLCLLPLLLFSRAPWAWPASKTELLHLCIAGLLMHAVNLGASHYTQYFGMSAGNVALILALQPLLTAVFAQRRMGEKLAWYHWAGILLGLGGVALVVWPKLDFQGLAIASLVSVTIALFAVTAGTLYQRVYCPRADLRVAALVQFGASLLLLVPLAWGVEGFALRWDWRLLAALLFLVVFSSILAVAALHTLMRRGQATKVTSLLFLTPVVAVLLEWLMFSLRPSWLTVAGMAITCAGVALVSLRAAR